MFRSKRLTADAKFSSSPDDRAHPQTALVPVASLAERRWAGAIDAMANPRLQAEQWWMAVGDALRSR